MFSLLNIPYVPIISNYVEFKYNLSINSVVVKVWCSRTYNSILLICTKLWWSFLADIYTLLVRRRHLRHNSAEDWNSTHPKTSNDNSWNNQITMYILHFNVQNIRYSFKNLSLDFYGRSLSYMFEFLNVILYLYKDIFPLVLFQTELTWLWMRGCQSELWVRPSDMTAMTLFPI